MQDCLDSGPAGTDKTESVNALNNQLGKFILVFNPDNVINISVRVYD